MLPVHETEVVPANAPSKPTTPPTTNPTRRATTARLFSFNAYLPDTLVHYAPKCVEGEFSEIRRDGVLGSSSAHVRSSEPVLWPYEEAVPIPSSSIFLSITSTRSVMPL